MALPALGQAFSGSVGSAIANIAVYPLEVVAKRLQVQRALSRRPETKRERDKRLERERLERDKEEELLAFSLDGDESDKEGQREKKERRLRREKEKERLRERRERKEKGRGMVFDDITAGHSINLGGSYVPAEGNGKIGAGLKPYPVRSVMADGGLAEKVRNDLLRERENKARGKPNSDYEFDDVDDDHDRERGNGVLEETEFRKRPRFKIVEGYEQIEGYYEEGDEVETEENYKGVADAFEKIFEKEGIKGLYTGVVEDTVNTIGNGFWYFATCKL